MKRSGRMKEGAQLMNVEALLALLFVAADVKTDDEKARVAWRFSSALWHKVNEDGSLVGLARAFNDLLHTKEWPWIDDLWSAEEMAERRAALEAMGRASDDS